MLDYVTFFVIGLISKQENLKKTYLTIVLVIGNHGTNVILAI